MFTEGSYQELSRDIYRIDPQYLTYEPELRVGKTIDIKDIQYKIPAFRRQIFIVYYPRNFSHNIYT